MDDGLPLVSLVIPCRNEAGTITDTIRSLLAQNYPAEKLELIFVDGMSTDGTRELIAQSSKSRVHGFPVFRLLDNPAKITAVALNKGVSAAKGEVIFTMGAHTRYSPNYISEAMNALCLFGADAVGSVARTVPGGSTPIARAIALALGSRFGVGPSLMRTGTNKLRSADTASCPGYRRMVFTRVGLFNPNLVRNQDIDFNIRLRRSGLRLLLHPGIKSYYRARPTLSGLFQNSFANGYWVIRGIKFSSRPFALRHLIPGLFVGALLVSIAPLLAAASTPFIWLPPVLLVGGYLVADVAAALHRIFATRSSFRLLPELLVVFPTLHIGYGLGSLWALGTLWHTPRQNTGGAGALGIATCPSGKQ
ncbi:MAG: glycosyltransferase family 2 protein [candidate division WOR-3 bacterium]